MLMANTLKDQISNQNEKVIFNDYSDGRADEIAIFAKDHPEKDSLYDCLRTLARIAQNNDSYSEIDLYKDFAPYSLGFTVKGPDPSKNSFSGGLIYHGPVDGVYTETFSVSLNPTNSWQIHT